MNQMFYVWTRGARAWRWSECANKLSSNKHSRKNIKLNFYYCTKRRKDLLPESCIQQLGKIFVNLHASHSILISLNKHSLRSSFIDGESRLDRLRQNAILVIKIILDVIWGKLVIIICVCVPLIILLSLHFIFWSSLINFHG